MGIAEGNALAHHVVSEVGGGGEAALGSIPHIVPACLQMGSHIGECPQAVPQGIDGIKQWLFIFLIVFVVGQWLGFHQCQQTDQMAVDPTGLAAYQLGNIRVLFLRHDGGTGTETIRQIDKTELRRSPQHQLF